ncbi:MAG: ABC transporter ATP-binding protein [Saprospiraceae bacterium]
MISIKHLHKSFGKNHVLKGVSIGFNKSGVSAVLGPNGSGKTTLIKTILGIVLADEGGVEVFGENIHRQWAYRSKIAYLPQIARFPENLKVKELVNMVKDLRGPAAKVPTTWDTTTATGELLDDYLIAVFGLEPFLDKRLSNLSGGTRQKVNLVLAFMYDCPVIILDEPTAGLDPISIVRLKKIIDKERQAGKTILVTTHVMSLVEELADEIVYLFEGHIHFRGSLTELKEKYGETRLEHAIAALLEQENDKTNSNSIGQNHVQFTYQPG